MLRTDGIGRVLLRATLLAGIAASLGCGAWRKGDDALPAKDAPIPAPLSADASLPKNAKHAELLEIARRLENSDERFFGKNPYRELLAADTTAMTDKEKAQYNLDLGMQAFRLDEPAEAEKALLRSVAIDPSPGALFMLGVAQLRIGEVDNCCNKHNAESCLVPLEGGGVHTNKAGADRALATFLRILETAPEAIWPQTRWFANLAAMAAGKWPDGVPERALIPRDKLFPPSDFPRFPDVAIEKGLDGYNLAGGSILDDFDGDGYLDLVTSTANVRGQLRYYRNRGDGSFEERTEAAGLLGQLGGLNVIHADYDGDGAGDLLVVRGGWMGPAGCMPKSLLKNRGDGTFVDVTEEAGLGGARFPGQTADFADYDLDGDLDLYFGHEMPKPESKLDYPCMLFRNEGNGKFANVTEAAGVGNHRFAKGVAWGDFDGDRDPDLYVSNHYAKNRLYRNEGNGTFVDVAEELKVTEPIMSFPTWWWDYDNDGGLDLFVGGYGGDLNTFVRSLLRPSTKFGLHTLYRNEGGRFRDVSKEAGLTLQSLAMGGNFGDLDNDGWLDFFLGTGSPEFDSLMPNIMYRNNGRGKFEDVTFAGGFGNIQKGHGVSFGDIDLDGDQDVFIELGGIYPFDRFYNALYENPGFGSHWISLDLVGTESNRDANGARVHVTIEEEGRPREIYRTVGACGSFGGSSLRQEIGLGKASRLASIEVFWPKTGATQRFEDVKMDSFYRIVEGAKDLERVDRKSFRLS